MSAHSVSSRCLGRLWSRQAFLSLLMLFIEGRQSMVGFFFVCVFFSPPLKQRRNLEVFLAK